MKKKLTEEEFNALPEEVQKGLTDGTMLALPVPVPSISSRYFTVSLALLVGVLFLPLIVPTTWILSTCTTIAAIGWLVAYGIESQLHANTKLKESIARESLYALYQLLDKAIHLDGTNQPETGLKEENDGTGTVH